MATKFNIEWNWTDSMCRINVGEEQSALTVFFYFQEEKGKMTCSEYIIFQWGEPRRRKNLKERIEIPLIKNKEQLLLTIKQAIIDAYVQNVANPMIETLEVKLEAVKNMLIDIPDFSEK
jgi:hypothetical protein